MHKIQNFSIYKKMNKIIPDFLGHIKIRGFFAYKVLATLFMALIVKSKSS